MTQLEKALVICLVYLAFVLGLVLGSNSTKKEVQCPACVEPKKVSKISKEECELQKITGQFDICCIDPKNRVCRL